MIIVRVVCLYVCVYVSLFEASALAFLLLWIGEDMLGVFSRNCGLRVVIHFFFYSLMFLGFEGRGDIYTWV
jgi:hypothetical protein